MEFISKPYFGSLKRYWRRRRYQRLDGATTSRRKNVKVERFHGSSSRSRWFWRIKAFPKLRLKGSASPSQLWTKFKDAYIQMMVNLAGKVGYLDEENVFGSQKAIHSKSGKSSVVYSCEEVEDRLVLEIYKALIAINQLPVIQSNLSS